MKLKFLKSLQTVLLINWIIVPVIFILIYIYLSLSKAIIFIILWLILDKVWDRISSILITSAGKTITNENEVLKIEISNYIPYKIAITMILDIIGTLALPWLISGFFLAWF